MTWNLSEGIAAHTNKIWFTIVMISTLFQQPTLSSISMQDPNKLVSLGNKGCWHDTIVEVLVSRFFKLDYSSNIKNRLQASMLVIFISLYAWEYKFTKTWQAMSTNTHILIIVKVWTLRAGLTLRAIHETEIYIDTQCLYSKINLYIYVYIYIYIYIYIYRCSDNIS